MNNHNILSLPDDLLINVLASSAAFPPPDLFNARMSCKTFYELSHHDYIYERASLHDMEIVPWLIIEERSTFFERCINSCNSEALYRRGVVEYFSGRDYELGFECIEKAANLGHGKALYALGIISLFGNDDSKKKGIEILNKEILKGRLWKCRGELIEIMNKLWKNIPPNMQIVVVCCSIHDNKQRKWKSTWPVNDSDDNVECEACKCDRELDYFMPCVGIRR